MARIEEATLFRPGQVQMPGRGGPVGPVGPGGGPGRGGDDDDGPQIAVRERVAEAGRAAKRRKGLSFVVMMICGALTVLGAIFAPRSYEVESRVLVQRTTAITGGQPNPYVSPEEMRNQAKEYEEQVMARDNIIAIVKTKNLVARWDDMRQPHRRLIDKLNRKLGKEPPGDDEKFEALVANIEHRMKVFVDATTVTVKLEWSEPTAARDIVEAAVKNFLDARYQSEVGVIPARLKIQEAFVQGSHKELETAAQQLVVLQAQKDPKKRVDVFIPTLPPTVRDETLPPPDPQLQAQLENVRGQVNALQGAKTQRLAELNQQLLEQQQQKGPQHPDIIGLKAQISAMQQDPPQLAQLKAQEAQLQAEINAKRAAQKAAEPRPAPLPAPRLASRDAGVVPPEPLPATAPKNVQDAQVQFDSASGKYQEAVKALQATQVELQTADAAYKQRYRVTHPAEVPAGPKRPVGLIAVLIGVLATIGAVLMVAALADRFSGIFFEPRDVRDRLGLPVFATFS
jgi:uncharacterized protein involved in exopolysaccharide biosynthesis